MTTQQNVIDAPALPDPATPAAPQTSLKHRAIRGSIWTVMGFGASQVLRLGSSLLLTRMLFPDAYGLMILVNVLMTGLAMFSDVGIGPAIVQSPHSEDEAFLNTAWTIQVGRGTILFLAACALAMPMAHFYGYPELAQIVPVVALSSLLSGFYSTSLSTYQRRLAVGRLTFLDLICQGVSIIAVIDIAYYWPSVWALVAGNVVATIMKLVGSYWLLPSHRHHFRIDPQARHELVHFGRWIFLSTVFGFIVSQSDRVILGKFLTLAQLGVYGIAYNLSQTVLSIVRQLADRVIFPVYRELHVGGQERLKHKTFRLRLALIAVSVPPLWILAIWGHVIIGFYDHRYHEASWMLELLSVSTIPVVIFASINPVLLAVGDSFRFMLLLGLHTISLVVAMLLGLWLAGTPGLIVGVGVAEVLNYPALSWAVRKYGVWLPWLDLGSLAVSAVVLGGLHALFHH